MTHLSKKYLSTFSLASALFLAACGGGGSSSGAGNNGSGTTETISTVTPATVTPATVTSGVAVTLSGTATYDRVPLNPQSNGLNFDATFQMPIRQAPVDLVDEDGTVIATTVLDDNGNYSFDVVSGDEVRVRIRSEIQQGAPNEVDLQVVDNTSGDVVYAIEGGLSVVPDTNQIRDLNAGSGWGGSSYTGERAAAPFALLDTVFEAMEGFIEVDSEIDFPAFDVQWSTRNLPEMGNVDEGQINSSSFTVENRGAAGGVVPVIRILGAENNDTDEFDAHVVVHEFGHYFENVLSRADSIGGPHSLNDRLDPRLAFGEGWGNALSGMILGDPIYRDSGGSGQAFGFGFNVENNVYPSTGWFSEGSVQSILYDLFDGDDDGADTTELGLGPIYRAFTDGDYQNSEAFTSIYSFLEALESQSEVDSADVTALTQAQLIFGSGDFGVGETNNGGLPDALPVYLTLPTDNTPVEFCSVDTFGEFNNHGVRRFFEFETTSVGFFSVEINRLSGAASSDPDFVIFRNGEGVIGGFSSANNVETRFFSLTPDRYVLEAYNADNLSFDGDTADVCYTISLEAL